MVTFMTILMLKVQYFQLVWLLNIQKVRNPELRILILMFKETGLSCSHIFFVWMSRTIMRVIA